MKIAGLGQKKNDLLTPSGEYPLPELTPRTAAPAARAETQPAPPPPASGTEGAANAARLRPEPAPAAEGPHPEPSGRAAPSPEPAAASGMRPDGNVPPAAAPATASGTAPATRPGPAAPIGTEVPAADTRPAAAPQPVPQPEARPAGTARRPLISGTSLSDLLASAGNPATQSEKTQDPEPAAATVDPECAAKLERARERILALIRERRPRFVPAFEQMLFRGDTIAVSVPTTELRDEILRSKTGMLMRIAELAGVTGRIELEITVNEQIRAARPIRLEDRVKYITEKNPLVAELRKALDLEVE